MVVGCLGQLANGVVPIADLVFSIEVAFIFGIPSDSVTYWTLKSFFAAIQFDTH